MGADVIIAALPIKEGRKPDYDAARAAAAALRADQVEVPDEFWDHDADTAAGLAEIRSEVCVSIAALEAAMEHGRELDWIHVRGLTVFLTGGLSCGDAPTELLDTFARLLAVPVVLRAAGFELAQ